MKNIFLILLCLPMFCLSGTIITGTIDGDTVWSPENNPYEVFDIVTITENTTLTIMPGTEVIMDSKRCICHDDRLDFFWEISPSHPGTFYIYGRIIACGTEQDSIIFTRPPNSPNELWGNFYIYPNAPLNIFEHCSISYSFSFNRFLGDPSDACIRAENGRIIVRNCHFYNNQCPVSTESNPDSNNSMLCEVTNNLFELLNNENDYLEYRITTQCIVWQVIDNGYSPLFAGNVFRNLPHGGGGCPNSVFNSFSNINSSVSGIASGLCPSYFYKNAFLNCGENGLDIIYGNAYEYPLNQNYIKSNSFIHHGFTSPQFVNFYHDAYAEIYDNYFEQYDFVTNMHASGKIFNNIFNNSHVITDSLFEFNNNIVYNGGSFYNYKHPSSNNIIILDDSEFAYRAGRLLENSIILTAQGEMEENIYSQLPPDTLRNCIIDFDIAEYPYIIDGGNNIVITPEQINEVFVNFANDDFHLSPGSPAIDAGYDTPRYEYNPFDLDGRIRQWSGIPGNDAIIDIGVYEYGSPELGEIMVNTYNAESQDIVNYVLLIFNDDPSDFEFTDNYGYALVKRPAGIYEVQAQRMLYEDVWTGEVEFVSGECGDLFIPLTPIYYLSDDNSSIPNIKSIHSIKNYPNPFNPSTTISYTLEETQNIQLTIYNIKGQKINTLVNESCQSGAHSIVWNGNDASGSPVASGLYFYRLKTDNETNSGKLMLLK
ncbi:MAG: T9SS type A sorting domain-containing protein [Candidatus Stygibacter australis]|nr:T9SS type A sorting domain-containing protein [Candidatus Stygibacter australis]MDP8322123.1 T9SS type A sorting domain-containing protein [Candidatus Stygibacter australis]